MNQYAPAAARQWQPTLLAIGATLLWVGYCYWRTLDGMTQIWWRSETYLHGFVVAPISLWLIWREREHLGRLQPSASFWLLLPLAGIVLLWLLGDLIGANALTQFAVVGIVVLAVMALVGTQTSRKLAFPLLFLFFSVPIGDFLMPRLMEWTADFTTLALRLTGIPVYREGQNFMIPSGHWSVIETCSGIRYLIASLMIGTLYAYLNYQSLQRRLALILVALLVPIVANWLRAYLIVMIGHLSDNRLAVGVDHLIYGWIFFGIVIATIFGIGMRWQEPAPAARDLASEAAPGSAKDNSVWLLAPAVALVIASGPAVTSLLRADKHAEPVALSLPESTHEWKAGPPMINWQPRFNQPSAQAHSSYTKDDRWVGVYVAYYRNQNYERKLVTSSNVLVGSQSPNWQLVARGEDAAPSTARVQRVRTGEILSLQNKRDERYLIWQWYWINGRLTSSDIEAKWLSMLSILSGQGDDGAVIILYAPKPDAGETLASFNQDLGDEIHRRLREARR